MFTSPSYSEAGARGGKALLAGGPEESNRVSEDGNSCTHPHRQRRGRDGRRGTSQVCFSLLELQFFPVFPPGMNLGTVQPFVVLYCG